MPPEPHSENRFHISWGISIGNILTIIGGIVVAAIFLSNASRSYQALNDQVGAVQSEVNDIRCALAFAGISATSQPCTVPPHRKGT